MSKKVFIIAEAGVNHNGSVKLAKKLIDVACEAKVDAVKFQTFITKEVISKNASKCKYQIDNAGQTKETLFEMVKGFELDLDAHKILLNYCNAKNIIFLSSPFDISSINLLNNLGLKIFKIPSGEINNLPYLKKIGKLNKKIILSTGMSNLDEINTALNILIKSGTRKKNITILHANTEYPTPMEDVNLKAMITIGKKFNVSYGYSDHTLGIEVDVAAVALGASCIEKHFTLDCNMKGPDHKASLEPQDLKLMVKAIRNIEIAMGNGVKKPSKSEKINKELVRKSIVAKINIKKGDIFNENNITTKRPGYGLSPMKWDQIIGAVAKRNYEQDDLI